MQSADRMCGPGTMRNDRASHLPDRQTSSAGLAPALARWWSWGGDTDQLMRTVGFMAQESFNAVIACPVIHAYDPRLHSRAAFVRRHAIWRAISPGQLTASGCRFRTAVLTALHRSLHVGGGMGQTVASGAKSEQYRAPTVLQLWTSKKNYYFAYPKLIRTADCQRVR